MLHSHRGVIAHRFGPPLDVLQVQALPPAAVKAGTAAVRMIVSPINPSDLIPVTGAYRSRTTLPFIPGFEGVGVIEEVHPGSDQTLRGQRVLPIGSAGGWQSVKTCPVDWCVPVPGDISDTQAATAYINPLTALRMVESHVGSPGIRTAVVNAAGSAIARTLGHLLRQRGIRAIGLRRHPGPGGAGSCWDEVIDTSSDNWRDELRALSETGRLDLAFDCVGREEGTVLAQALKPGGIFVHYGLLSGQPLAPSLWRDRPDLTIDLFRLRGWVHSAGKHQVLDAFSRVFDLIRDGVVNTRIQAELPLDKVKIGIELSLTQASQGKVLLRP
ncbi:zinc-dependent alcohol dehydrogenase family protein [Corynebacterium pseudodiphtheriticum]|uniref:zinc-dependent alcohol dehydrogenase family protein n=1 Tax=Corynebacterium pseudodiphtheriticum TaxID=37637 RepID=UPI00234C2497|nr:zinc-dependent alcohol dehydrogenase family protein [Corynebacterium pseudodiphtheriticum]MDC7113053.1 zinc-dependent alcohol dehydrogenase family protein [Corynebacterium pseudodiphtheriticum]